MAAAPEMDTALQMSEAAGFQSHQIDYLLATVQQLALARDLDSVIDIARQGARRLTGADGAAFVLKDGSQCYYVDEDAIGPLWKGQRFPMSICISGWSMVHRQAVAIEDIYSDSRIPADAYRPTFVKSLAMVPIRSENPIGAIGNYWASTHQTTDEELRLLQALADSISIAMENVQLLSQLQGSVQKAKASATELERQLLLRDEFISIAAHELNTPLTSLKLQIQMLQRMIARGTLAGHTAETRLHDFLSLAQRQVGHLSDLVTSLLDVSKIHLDRFELTFQENVDVSALVRAIADRLRPVSGIAIDIILPNEPITSRCDPVRVDQAISNIVVNAIKYGQGKPVDLWVESTDTELRISVRDRGIGIAECDRERIFERFERAVSLQSFGGMGLGLYISRKIVEGHGGRIFLQSEVGGGSTFTIKLPAQKR